MRLPQTEKERTSCPATCPSVCGAFQRFSPRPLFCRTARRKGDGGTGGRRQRPNVRTADRRQNGGTNDRQQYGEQTADGKTADRRQTAKRQDKR